MCKDEENKAAACATTTTATLTAGLLAGDKTMPALPGDPTAPEDKGLGNIPTAGHVEDIPDDDDAVCETSAVRGVRSSHVTALFTPQL